MGLTSQQLDYLRNADQRFRAKVGIFPAYTPVITPPTIVAVVGQPLAPVPMPMCSPRHALVAYGATISLYGRDSYNRGGAYVGNANISFANTGGAGTLVDNGDGTATWTAPGVGSGTNLVTVTVSNANGSAAGNIYLQYPDTTYDNVVAEIASISAGVDQHCWKVTMRVRGDTTGFVAEAGILLHIEDTWAGTTSTFGGYQYPEGVFFGYITQTEYFEDAFGETWLGVECVGPWNKLQRLKVGETWWGTTSASGRFYLSTFAPVDAIWHFVTKITDFAQFHNCTLFFDGNTILDLIIEESDLATIFDDVMARTLATAWTDRYGSLMCIPDPDVRAGEWWGTPSPVFDSTGAGPLTETFVRDYHINTYPYRVRKLSIQAIDSSKFGIWAVSQNVSSALGSVDLFPGKLICDSPSTLAGWVAQLRAKQNRKWDILADRFLDHTVDLMNFVDVSFTSPTQTNGVTASGRTWVNSISYSPNIWDGGWNGSWQLLKQTSGDVDGTSAWGGTGQFWTGVPGFTGTGVGNWTATAGGISSFCKTFDFVNSGAQGWSANTGTSGSAIGVYVPGTGWSAAAYYDNINHYSAARIQISRYFPTRLITSVTMWFNSQSAGSLGPDVVIYFNGTTNATFTVPYGPSSFAVTYNNTDDNMALQHSNTNGGTNPVPGGGVLVSAKICGSGSNPFG